MAILIKLAPIIIRIMMAIIPMSPIPIVRPVVSVRIVVTIIARSEPNKTGQESNFGSEGWGFESLQARVV